jgi:SOS-response transcriptional repressor LexA
MHPIQRRLLELAATQNVFALGYRELGRLIDPDEPEHPQKVKHHFQQLVGAGLLRPKGEEERRKATGDHVQAIPILGSANCGAAAMLAEENVEGYLRVSTRLVPRRKGLYALRAVGDSMDRASINGRNIEDGDYVVVDSLQRNHRTNDIVVSSIDDLANIKRIVIDRANQQVALTSVSARKYPPIYIHPEETSYYVCGTVLDVVKAPK